MVEKSSRTVDSDFDLDYVMDRLLHYDIARLLGEGKNGPTYLAYDTGLQRAVVIKKLDRPWHSDDSWWNLYQDRIKNSLDQNDTRLAAVYGHERGEAGCFVIREYIEGESLAEIAQGGKVDQRRLLNLILGAAEAVRTAHELNLIHGNISSHNILVTDSQNLLLCDLALEPSREYVRNNEVSTNDAIWLSPEQLRGQEATESSDLYSLGLAIVHLITGEIPGAGLNIEDLRRSRTATLLSAIDTDQHPPLIRLLLNRLLTEDPGNRLSNAMELCRTMQEIIVFGDTTPRSGEAEKKKFTPRQYMLMAVLVLLLVIFWLVITSGPR